jgi:hypothetical protein
MDTLDRLQMAYRQFSLALDRRQSWSTPEDLDEKRKTLQAAVNEAKRTTALFDEGTLKELKG